ncbi:MAG: phytoene desaturase family protein [Candidatus Kapaibacterium sp.]
MKKAIVIGAGIGALALGIRLLGRGIEVEIFEKNSHPGGHAGRLEADGYTFDMGPTLITAPEIIENIFLSVGENFRDYTELIRLDPYYRVYFHDDTYIDYSGDGEAMKRQMAAFNPVDAASYDDFIEHSRKIYSAIIEDGLGGTPFNRLSTMLRFAPKALRLGAFSAGYSIAARYFEDFRHRFMFSFHPLFIGGNPFRVPAVYLMISYLEKAGGVWYTPGGMRALVSAMTEVFEKHGGRINYNLPVERIIVKNRKAIGVKASGNNHLADMVVSNADVTHTYNDLLNREKTLINSVRIDMAKYSMSAFILYLGVRKKFDKLRHHTIILSKRYRDLVDDIFEAHHLPDDFSLYLHVPSRTDETMAPPGCESIYALAPVTNLQGKIDWQTKSIDFCKRIVTFLENDFGLSELEQNIEFKAMLTPEDFRRRTNSHMGTPWGMEPILRQSAYFRPHNRSEEIGYLYIVGAGTHPGGGLPGVMLSAEATMKLIEEDFTNKS